MTFNSQILPQFSSNLFEAPTYNNIKNPDMNTSNNLLFEPLNLPTFSFTPKGDDLQNNDTPIVDETVDNNYYRQDTFDGGLEVEAANKKILLKLIGIGLVSTLLIGGIIFLIVKKSK